MKKYYVVAHVEFEVWAENDDEMSEVVANCMDYPDNTRIIYEQIEYEER